MLTLSLLSREHLCTACQRCVCVCVCVGVCVTVLKAGRTCLCACMHIHTADACAPRAFLFLFLCVHVEADGSRFEWRCLGTRGSAETCLCAGSRGAGAAAAPSQPDCTPAAIPNAPATSLAGCAPALFLPSSSSWQNWRFLRFLLEAILFLLHASGYVTYINAIR